MSPISRSQSLPIRSAAISRCGRYRWWLKREWGDGPAIAWIMLNPARADEQRDDPTIRRVIHFSQSWGFGAATVVNLYPFRSTIPAECRGWTASSRATFRKQMRENDRTIAEIVQGASAIAAAWGTVGWAQERAELLVADLARAGAPPLQCLGTTLDGSPLHPMARGRKRVPDDRQPIAWPTQEY
jgi:hypothetical protein